MSRMHKRHDGSGPRAAYGMFEERVFGVGVGGAEISISPHEKFDDQEARGLPGKTGDARWSRCVARKSVCRHGRGVSWSEHEMIPCYGVTRSCSSVLRRPLTTFLIYSKYVCRTWIDARDIQRHCTIHNIYEYLTFFYLCTRLWCRVPLSFKQKL